MTGFWWLAVGALLGLGHWAATALPYIGGACIVLALVLLGAIALHAATWAIRRERQLEQIAGGGLDDTAPLSVYEEAVFAAIDQENRSSE